MDARRDRMSLETEHACSSCFALSALGVSLPVIDPGLRFAQPGLLYCALSGLKELWFDLLFNYASDKTRETKLS